MRIDRENGIQERPIRGEFETNEAYGAIDYEFQSFLKTAVLFFQAPSEGQFENCLLHARAIIQFLGPMTSKTSVDDIKPIDFGVAGNFWGDQPKWFRKTSGIIDKHLAHLTWARANAGNSKPQGLLIAELLENVYPKMVEFAEELERCRPERAGMLSMILKARSPGQVIDEERR